MGCSKFLLFVLNFVVFIVGGAVVALASVVISKTNHYTNLLQDGILTLPIIVLIIGLIIAVIGFFGCFGALRENQCMLYTYALVVICLFIAQLTLGILIFLYQNETKETTKVTLKQVFQNYNPEQDEALASTINSLQSDLECCGVESYEDWFAILAGDDATPGCCKPDTDINSCYKNAKSNQDSIYTRGCYYAVEDQVTKGSYALGITTVILAIVQLACIMIACGLGKAAGRRSEYA